MASVTVDWTGVNPQALQTTQPMIIKAFLEDTGLGYVSTTTGASATVITDATMLDMDIASPQKWRGAYVRMVGGTALNLGSIRAVTDYSPTAGTITVAPALPANTTSGDAYELWMTPAHPRSILNMLDRLTSEFGLFLPSQTFLSEVPDYDMEQTGTAGWTSGNATIAKATFSTLRKGVLGRQALTVATTAANGYATSAKSYGVRPGNAFWVSAQFTPLDTSVQTTGFLQLYDVTNSTPLYTMRTTSKSTTRLLRLISSTGTTTQVNIRMGQEENGVTGIWDEVVFLDSQAQDVPLPYWMTSQGSLKETYVWTPWQTGVGMDEYDPALVGDVTDQWTPYFDGFSNGGQLRLRADSYPKQLMFVDGVRSGTTWESLTEVKHYDVAWAASGLALNYYQRMVSQFVGSSDDRKPLQEQVNYWDQKWRDNLKRVVSRRRTNDGAPTQWYMSA